MRRTTMLALALAGAGLGAAACADRRPPKLDAAFYAAQVDKAVPKIERAIGVPFKRPPRLEVRSRQQVRDFLVKQFDESAPQQQLAGQEAAYKAFGLIPDTTNLRRYLTDLLTEQVIGYYDPSAKTLYVVSGAPEDVARLTITHELVHALQDQYVNLDSIQKAAYSDDDRASAAQAVIEGQATYEQVAMMVGSGNIAAQFPGGWDRVRDIIRDDKSQPIFSAAPMAIQESLLFPYVNGAEFVRRYKERRGGKLPLSDLPSSTEQVLHDSAFFGNPPDAPTRVTLPKVPGAIYDNDLGEFGTRLFLFQHSRDQNGSVRASVGWDGDRYVVVRVGKGTAIAWVTVWDTPFDAAEFVNAAEEAMAKRYGIGTRGTGSAARTLEGRGRTVQITPGEIGGRNVVLVVDVPQGTSPALVDLGTVTLSP